MLRKAALLMLTALLLGAGARPARADDAALGRSGETVFPVGEPSVRMAAEEVLLKVDPERTQADLTFTFANAGPDKTVLMGFPLQSHSESRAHPELNDFRTLIDGVAAPVKTEPSGSGEYPGWITWPVTFRANQTRVVQNSYWGTNSYWSNGETMAGYILKTGAAWQGTIGQAVVRASLDQILPPDMYGIRPENYRWVGDDLVWEWQEFEPDSDIEIHWNHRGWQNTILEAMGPDANVAFPPGPPLTGLTDWRLTHPNTSGRTDAVDLVILRSQFLNGDHRSVKQGVQQALAAGIQDSLIAYLAVKEGLRQPREVSAWHDLNPPTLRWLQDQAGPQPAPRNERLPWWCLPLIGAPPLIGLGFSLTKKAPG